MEGHSNLTQRRMKKQEFLGKLPLIASIELGWGWDKGSEEWGGVDCNVKKRRLSSPELDSVFVT